jgi:hypothetical protein
MVAQEDFAPVGSEGSRQVLSSRALKPSAGILDPARQLPDSVQEFLDRLPKRVRELPGQVRELVPDPARKNPWARAWSTRPLSGRLIGPSGSRPKGGARRLCTSLAEGLETRTKSSMKLNGSEPLRDEHLYTPTNLPCVRMGSGGRYFVGFPGVR